jgi:hypothetical protein
MGLSSRKRKIRLAASWFRCGQTSDTQEKSAGCSRIYADSHTLYGLFYRFFLFCQSFFWEESNRLHPAGGLAGFRPFYSAEYGLCQACGTLLIRS